MRIKKFVRFLMLLVFVNLAAIVPVPIIFHRKENKPSFEIEQFDKKEDEVNSEDDYQAFS